MAKIVKMGVQGECMSVDDLKRYAKEAVVMDDSHTSVCYTIKTR
jgi:hypothetical protein